MSDRKAFSVASRRYRCRHRRRAFTIVEMIFAITLTAMLLLTLVMALTSLIGSERALRTQLMSQSQIVRLMRMWRSDVHRAQTIDGNLTTSRRELMLRQGKDRTITYRFDPTSHTVFREESTQGRLVRREAFVVPKTVEVAWGQRDSQPADRDWLRMDIGSSQQPVHIVALLNAATDQPKGNANEVAHE